jgi:hypothetical protein
VLGAVTADSSSADLDTLGCEPGATVRWITSIAEGVPFDPPFIAAEAIGWRA